MEELKLILEMGENATAAAIGVALAWGLAQILIPLVVMFGFYKTVEVIAFNCRMCSKNGKLNTFLVTAARRLKITNCYRTCLSEVEQARTLAQLWVALEILAKEEESQ